jgi:hypothetical protein
MSQTSDNDNGHKFEPGDEVQSISDPSRIGVVVEICELHAGVQWYRVNFGAGDRPKMPEPDLRPFVPTDKPCDNLIGGNIDGYREFQRLITQQRLLRDHPFNTVSVSDITLRQAIWIVRLRSAA